MFHEIKLNCKNQSGVLGVEQVCRCDLFSLFSRLFVALLTLLSQLALSHKLFIDRPLDVTLHLFESSFVARFVLDCFSCLKLNYSANHLHEGVFILWRRREIHRAEDLVMDELDRLGFFSHKFRIFNQVNGV